MSAAATLAQEALAHAAGAVLGVVDYLRAELRKVRAAVEQLGTQR